MNISASDWSPLYDKYNNIISAGFKCPTCGVKAYLTDHEVDASGKVTPSVECPLECGFHEHVVLEGWKPS